MKQTRKKTQKTSVDNPTSAPGLVDSNLGKYNFCITFGIVVLLSIFIFQDFILGRLYYLFHDVAEDSITTAFPGIYHTARYLRTEGFPLWSFAQGMGQNIMAGSLADPFYSIVYLAGDSHGAYAIVWMEIAKILVTAAAFYHFLNFLNFNNLSKIIGTVLYCFSGFMMVGGQWWIFSTEACYLALLLWSFEKLYCSDSWHFFPVVVALIAMHNPFELYTSSSILFIYFIFRHVTSEESTFKTFLSRIFKMIYLGTLGILMSCVFLVSNIQRIMESPRVGGGFSYFQRLSSIGVFTLEKPEHYVTALLRFFSNDIMGNGVTYSGWHNYLEAPLLFIGLLPLLLLPQIFLLLKKRKLIAAASLLLVAIIPVILPYFRYAFFLFSGDYYRVFSQFAALTVLILGLSVFREVEEGEKSINMYILTGTLVFFLAVLWYPYQTNITNISIADGSHYPFSKQSQWIVSLDQSIRVAVSIFLILYAAILTLFRYAQNRTLLGILLLVMVVIETGYMNLESLKGRQALSPADMADYAGGDRKDAVDYIKSTDKGFFRINMDAGLIPFTTCLYNQAKLLDYYGTASYDSFNQKYYIRFLEEMGILRTDQEADSRYSIGLIPQPLSWSFASVKYHIAKGSDPAIAQLGFRPIKLIGKTTIYQNSRFLPLGYTYNQYIPIGKFRSLSPVQKGLVLQKAVVTEEPVDPEIARNLKQFDRDISSQDTTAHAFFQDIALLNENTFHITRFSQNKIEGTIKLASPKMVFFTIPYDRGWRAFVDNKKVKPQLMNLGFTGFLLGSGQHSIHLSYVPRYFTANIILSALGLLIYLVLMILHHRLKNIPATA